MEFEPVTRREVLAKAAAGSLALSAGGILPGCFGDDDSPVAGTAGEPRAGGTLRAGISGGSPSGTLDPILLPLDNPSFARIFNLFDPLVRMDPDGKPEFALAESFESNSDATVWTLRVREGVEFHDGKTLTVDDVIYTFQTILNPEQPGWGAPSLAAIDPKGFKKRDRYTLDIACKGSFATLLETLATSAASIIVPEGFNANKAVGTGPFKLRTFDPGTESTFDKNPNYWRTDRPYVDTLVITNFPDDTAQANALAAGQVDVINQLSTGSINEVESAGKKLLISEGGGWIPFTMRVDAAPFDDVRVRQALRLGVDREEMLELVFGPNGTVGNDVMGIFAPEYDDSLPQRTQDIEQAKSLLKAAGQENLTVELVTSEIAQGTVRSAEVFAQQVSEAGVKVNVRKVEVAEFFGNNYLKWPFAQDTWLNAFYFTQVGLATLSTAPFNETHFDHKRYDDLYAQAIAEVDEGKRAELAHEMQKIEYDEGGYIIPFFPSVIDAYAENVGGLKPTRSGLALGDFRFSELWLT